MIFAPINTAFLKEKTSLLSSIWARFFSDLSRGSTGNSNFPTGIIIKLQQTGSRTGWIEITSDGTIGNLNSGGTARANVDTQDLYELLWNGVSDTYCPVSGGRGTTATNDFNNNKAIALPKLAGRALGIAGAGSGLTSRAVGSYVGTQTHLLTIAEGGVQPHFHDVPAHDHDPTLITMAVFSVSPHASDSYPWFYPNITTAGSLHDLNYSGLTVGTPTTADGAGILTGSTSSDASSAHSNVQPTSYFNYYIKL